MKAPLETLLPAKSSALTNPEAVLTYTPFSALLVWFLTKTLSPSANVTPSTTVAAAKSTFSVLATLTEALTSKPWTTLSTYALVAACISSVGSAANVKAPVIVSPVFLRASVIP